MAACTKIEFAVKMTCQRCVDAVQKVLNGIEGIVSLQVLLETHQVIVVTCLAWSRVQELLESTGRKAVLLAVGPISSTDQASANNISSLEVVDATVAKPAQTAAVVMLFGAKQQRGVIRLIQLSDDLCLIDGTVDGLSGGLHSVCIHEYGDLQNDFDECGDVFSCNGDANNERYGNLGQFELDETGQLKLRIESRRVKVYDIIGRSIVVHCIGEKNDETKRVAGGIIARSSGLFKNSKRICACSGATIWEERDVAIRQALVRSEET